MRRIGIQRPDGRPGPSDEVIRASRSTSASRCGSSRSPRRTTREPLGKFDFARYLWNTVFVTVVATLITLLINSMAAFALSKYELHGQERRPC